MGQLQGRLARGAAVPFNMSLGIRAYGFALILDHMPLFEGTWRVLVGAW